MNASAGLADNELSKRFIPSKIGSNCDILSSLVMLIVQYGPN